MSRLILEDASTVSHASPEMSPQPRVSCRYQDVCLVTRHYKIRFKRHSQGRQKNTNRENKMRRRQRKGFRHVQGNFPSKRVGGEPTHTERKKKDKDRATELRMPQDGPDGRAWAESAATTECFFLAVRVERQPALASDPPVRRQFGRKDRQTHACAITGCMHTRM